ncbi:MAG TPA: PepSY domain-containing protein [Bryobacteraceae bacterium]|nr:PepSY domain-containing protein [Bryobacteraceae bacterium]
MIYKLLRNIHLLAGLFALPALLTYAVSSVQMAHRIRIPQNVTEEDATLAPGLAPRAAALQLMAQQGFSGDLGGVLTTPAQTTFSITRVGSRYQVGYDPGSGRAHVKRTDTGILGELNRLHHLHGLHHENRAMNAWAVMLAAVSLILLTIGVTGIYMWFKLQRERVIGAILLSVNLIISIGLLTFLRS